MHIAVNDENIVNELKLQSDGVHSYQFHLKPFQEFEKSITFLGMSLSKIEIPAYGRNKVVGTVSIAK